MSDQIVFTRAIENNANRLVADIYVMNPDGSNLRRLTTNPLDQEWDCAGPVWRPVITQIVFMSYLRRPSINTSDLYVMDPDPDAANVTPLTDGPADNDDPDVSPSGRLIVFARGDGSGKSALHRIAIDGTDLGPLTSSQFSDYSPAWERAGSRIAFLRELSPYPNRRTELCIINDDGTGERQLTSFGGIIFDPTWSPDGTRIAFASRIFDPFRWDIYSVDAATGGFLVRHTPGGADHFSPCYSPDGTRMALASNRGGGPYKIYAFELGSSYWVPLTSGPYTDNDLDWL